MAVQIHYVGSLQPDSKPDNNACKEAAWAMGIEIIGKKQLCHKYHHVLKRAFVDQVQYNKPEIVQPSGAIQHILRNIENCDLFPEPAYDHTY